MLSRLARTLSGPASRWDAQNLRLQDGLNRRLAGLWWPVGVPDRGQPMSGNAHLLYGAHAWLIARALGMPRRRAWMLLTLVSWALFTGAWDRRAGGH